MDKVKKGKKTLFSQLLFVGKKDRIAWTQPCPGLWANKANMGVGVLVMHGRHDMNWRE
ncbi:MAG: hypothetical protein PT958_06865 [Firmicutes bacterium]|nr:hypothetical protein [Bacillota bacterium]